MGGRRESGQARVHLDGPRLGIAPRAHLDLTSGRRAGFAELDSDVRVWGLRLSEPARARRRYDGTLRRLRAAETRERIVAAGSELLHDSPIRDWRSLTVRAVAERAGVNQRTIYRHFLNERALRDAVMHRLEKEADIDLAGLRLEDVAKVAARIFAHVSSYPLESRPPLDPTLSAAGQRQRKALLDAVTARTPQWQQADRVLAAAMLDVLWSVASYERLAVEWRLDRAQAIRGIRWVIALVEETIRKSRRPSGMRL